MNIPTSLAMLNHAANIADNMRQDISTAFAYCQQEQYGFEHRISERQERIQWLELWLSHEERPEHAN